jgi:hypothetical protein
MHRGHVLRIASAFGGFFLLAVAGAAQDANQAASRLALPQTIEFNRDIRPILSDKCFTCHGPDKSHRVTAFHFDVEESAKQDLGNGHFAVFPGDLAKSALIQRVTAQDERRRMPPIASGRKLSEREIALLKEWIEQGAKWEKHWSFVPPKRPDVPQVTDGAWARNPIDSFILHRLEKEGLKPSPEADRATLLRRVTLDLTGKGPTPAEMDAFLTDKSPDAYERVVNRLLASPHYGERMALPWLDAARYADTSGYQQDHERFMWRWRDWVIQAFNKNMPFDQFATEQLAGDLLPNPTLDQKVATGFNRNHRTNAEGGIIAEEFAAEYVVDRVATTSSVFLGLTVGCARCHDHKYDPISQKEFYQLFAYFNNVPELGHSRRGNTNPYIKAPTPEQQSELKRLDVEIAGVNAGMARLEPTITSAEGAWLKSVSKGKPADWTPARGLVAYYPLDGTLQGKITPSTSEASTPEWKGDGKFADGVFSKAASFDGSNVIDAGNVGNFDYMNKFTLSAWIFPVEGTGAIVTRFQGEPQGKGYGMRINDRRLEMLFAFRTPDHDILVDTEKQLELNRWHHVMATYGGNPEARNVALYVDGIRQDVKVIGDLLTESATIKEPLRIGGEGGSQNRFHGLIDDVRVFDTELTPEEAGILAASKTLNELGGVPPAQRTKAESDKVRSAFLTSGAAPASINDLFQQLTKLREERQRKYENVSTLMVMEELPAPRETHVLLRGAYDQPGEQVTPGVPAILPPMPGDFPKNRLGLAKWLVDSSNPLTARVAVNRYWQMYFGTGIVKTVDDFGSQGDAPSHPELLDWLATEFIRTGWDVKAMQKTIVTSATYRQVSKATPEVFQKDPENRLLAHGARFRLPAEMVRDEALAISGLLVEKEGGPSVKPYQPAGLWNELAQLTGDYNQDHGDNLYRRSLYTFWKRTIPPPSMANFDAPSRESCIMQRGLTNSPLQALDLMNDVTYVEAARVFAERMMKDGGSSESDRIAFAFRLAIGRIPTDREKQILSDSLHYARDRFATNPDNAVKYLKVGEHPRDQKLDPKELAAYTSVASLIINLDETVTKD